MSDEKLLQQIEEHKGYFIHKSTLREWIGEAADALESQWIPVSELREKIREMKLHADRLWSLADGDAVDVYSARRKAFQDVLDLLPPPTDGEG